MSTLLRAVLVGALASVLGVLALPAAAQAAPVPDGAVATATVSPDATSTVGYDVSHPQCGSPLPTGQAFGIVGVNGGLATTANPCLGDQLTWAWASSGSVASQPKAQLYLNTANPGQVRDQVTTWPGTGATPYGSCTGGNTTACSWEYGWERAQNSVTNIFVPTATTAGVPASPGSYTWWLDVETANTWQSGSSAALARNRATLEGMTAYLTMRGARVGLYSVGTQWKQIAGTVGSGSTLYRLDSWLAGASSLSGAKTNCGKPPLVAGGHVTLAQYVISGLDRDRSCR